MIRPPIHRLALLALLVAVTTGPAASAGTQAPEWATVAAVDTVEVVTHDEDGDVRDTTVWLIVVDGQGYVRTGNTRWGANVVRDPQLVLRVEESEYPMRAEFVEDDARREKIVAAFREKYGFTDSFMSLFRGSRPKIMRLLPR